MLLSKEIEINIGSNNYNHYKALGYEIPKIGKSKRDWKMVVNVDDLPKTSTSKVDVSCEKCGDIRTIMYKDLFRTRKSIRGKDGKTYCKTCVKIVLIGNPLYHEYKKGALIRGFKFELTMDEFYEINKLPCHYCGGMNTYSRVRYKGNGVDRKDNSKGYVEGNCVPCCSVCNRGKGSMPYDDFVDYIAQLRNYKWQ